MKIIRLSDPNSDISTFTDNIPKHAAVVMVYMMEGCPHCENLKPTWETVKKIMHTDNRFNNVVMADIDSNIASLLPLPPVMTFPNIRVLKGSKLIQYDGVRDVDPLLSFLRKTVTTPKSRTHHKSNTHPKSSKHR